MIHVRKRWLAYVGVNWTGVLRNKLGTYCSGPSERCDALDWFGGDRGDRKWMCWVYAQEVYLHRLAIHRFLAGPALKVRKF